MVTAKFKRIIIAAVAQNGFIGYKNSIPWNSSEELSNFRKITLNSPIIFGRITFDSLNKKLDERLNIVISSNPDKYNKKTDLLTFTSLSKAYSHLKKNNYEKVYICGGSRIYRSAIKYAEEMIISFMKFNSRGDMKFPRINPHIWEVENEKEFNDFVLRYYSRKK